MKEDHVFRLRKVVITLKRVHVLISGRVQHVYFRHHTEQEAAKYHVNGWVRNLPDGRVEALFEGEEGDVDRILQFCRTGPPSAHVEQVEAVEEPFVGEFKDFMVRQ